MEETYIKLSDAIEAIVENGFTFECANSILKNCPTQTILTGNWIGKPIAGYSDVRCSNCKTVFFENKGKWKYCPECGAKMTNSGVYNTHNSESNLWKTNPAQAYKELVTAVEPLREFYDIDKVKPYAIYVWTEDEYDNWGVHFGCNVFDVWSDKIQFYSREHQIPDEAIPIIQNIQSKLRRTT